MPTSADQWRAVVGSNSVRRPRQVISIEQLLLRYLSKTSSQQDGGGPQDATLSASGDATVDATGPSAQTETLCTPKGCNSDTMSDVEAAEVMRVLISAVCVQVLQSFVSMVNLSLLILSGDVETNPGPTGMETPEYRTIVACIAIKNNLAQGAAGIADTLFSKSIISDDTHYRISHAFTGRDKADILFEAVTAGIVTNSDNFHKFVSAVKASGPWADDMVGYIMEIYEKEKRKGHTSKPSASRQRTDVNEIIDGIAKHYGLTPDQLDVPCDGGHLLKISHLIANWKAYASYLGLSDQEEQHIQTDITLIAPHQRPEAMLKKWQKNTHNSPHSHYRHLLRACIEVENNRLLAGQICDVIKIPPPDSLPTTTVPQEESSSPQEHAHLTESSTFVPNVPSARHQETIKQPSPVQQKVLNSKQQPSSSPPQRNQHDDVDHTGSNTASPSGQQPLKASEPRFCVAAPFKPPPVKKDTAAPYGAQHGQAATGKLWPPGSVLLVYIMNRDALERYGCSSDIILEWAEKWEAAGPLVPRFEETDDCGKAHIRLQIANDGGSWSMVGTNAKTITNLSDPTMALQLSEGHKKYNKHTTIHEFGHALGLEHEHQRSKFWSVANTLIDVDKKMRTDPQLKGTDINGSYLEAKQVGDGTPEYDPDSVMHYWFDEGWLKDGLDPRTFNVDQDKVYKGIKRRHANRYVQKPSPMDIAFVKKCYGAPVNEGNTAAARPQPAPERSRGPTQSGNGSVTTPPVQAQEAKETPKLDIQTLLRNKPGLTDEELSKTQVEDGDLDHLAGLFDSVDFYVDRLSLTRGEKTDVKKEHKNTLAMKLALEYWKGHNPFDATFKALLLIVLDVPGKGEIACGICDYYMRKRQSQPASPPVVHQPNPNLHYQNGQASASSTKHENLPVKSEIASKAQYQKRENKYSDKAMPQQKLLPQLQGATPSHNQTQNSQASGRQSHEPHDQSSPRQQKPAAATVSASQQESTSDRQGGLKGKLVVSSSSGTESIQERVDDTDPVEPEPGEPTARADNNSPPEIPSHSYESMAEDAEPDAPQAQPLPVIKIGVVGSTNSGKSTTINALLRGKFLPSSCGGTTAHVLCIKHDPAVPEGKLYDLTTDAQNPIATGEKEILLRLDILNKEARQQITQQGPASMAGKLKLELRIKMPFLQEEHTNLELYDTPGISERTDSPIYKNAIEKQQEMDGLIVVYSHDTVLLDNATEFCEKLRKKLPAMVNLEKCAALVNKYDLLFPNEGDKVTMKKGEIADRVEVSLGQLIFYSAELGLEARLCQDRPESVDEDRYDDLKAAARKILKQDVRAIQGKDIEQLSEVAERGSCICEAEAMIKNLVTVLSSMKKENNKGKQCK